MCDLSQLRQAVARCMQQRDRVLHRVLHNKPYIAAQVYNRYKTCGNKNCKCHSGEPHGPFVWIYQHKKGQKLISTTVDGQKVADVRQLAANYQCWLEQRQQLRELDRRIQQHLDEMETLLEQEAKDYVTQRKPGRPGKQVSTT